MKNNHKNEKNYEENEILKLNIKLTKIKKFEIENDIIKNR